MICFETVLKAVNIFCHIWYQLVVKFDPENKAEVNFFIADQFLQLFHVRLCSGSITNKKFGTSITPDVIITPYCEGISVSVNNLSAVYIPMISLIALIKKSQYGVKWKDEVLTENYRKYQLSLSEQIHWSVLIPHNWPVFFTTSIFWILDFWKVLLARWERHPATLLAVFFKERPDQKHFFLFFWPYVILYNINNTARTANFNQC